ncbi:MAG TPA: DPP IV N-terminal domain-containing protein [Candidatus Acidoferrales bacterium]|nr:DPP IV N-terminal domain-containing protein [Candidatus Acidoferrales bacterium]
MGQIFRRAILATALLLLAVTSAYAQGTLQDYQRAEKFLPGNARHLYTTGYVMPNWIAGPGGQAKSDRFWYRKTSLNGDQIVSEFVVVDAAQNTSGPAFDHARLAEALTRATKQHVDATNLPFEEFEFIRDAKAIRFEMQNARWTCDLEKYECKKDEPASENEYESVSPNGRWAAYVENHNLYLRDTSTGTILQLTRDGIPGYDYATPLPSLRAYVAQQTDEPKERPAVFWSPDSSKFVTYRIDSRNAGRFTSLQFVPPNQLRPRAFTVVYPLPGEALPQAEPIVFDVLANKRVEVKTAPLDIAFQGGPFFDWFPDNKHFHYEAEQRGWKEIELRDVDAETGEQKTLISESAKTYVDPGETSFQFLDNDSQIVMTSERDGWNHIYLYNAKTGALERQLTKGDWAVREITAVDDKARKVYFLAGGREKGEDPYLAHLYSVGLDGTGLQLLTPENANHDVTMSPDNKYFVDDYSRVDLPGGSALRRADSGAKIRDLEKADVSRLTAMGWKPPEPFEGKATDGKTDLYGLIWKPTNFDASKKYPIVEQIYTGPQGFFVPKTFPRAMYLQSMSELGFVMVMVDGRGTTGRSRAFHEFSYHNLGGAFADHVAMIKQMAEKNPYMDIDRVGIYGTSAGGYGSAHAFLSFPDFYKVCVSISGDHDARLDKAWWNELYQGYPVGNDYAEQSNAAIASHLKGHLLLVHGDIDDNVHPVETMRLVDALMSANKSFDMLFVPNMFHGESGVHAHYLARRRWDYFVQYLLGVTPPVNFDLHDEPLPPFRFRRRR